MNILFVIFSRVLLLKFQPYMPLRIPLLELHFANALVTLVLHVYIDIFEIHIDLLLGDTKVQ